MIPRDAQRVCSEKSNWRESLLHGSYVCRHRRATASDAARGAFMTLPPYTRTKEDEVQELGCGVRKHSRRARSRPLSATSESMERAGEGTSAHGPARGASRGKFPCRVKR